MAVVRRQNILNNELYSINTTKYVRICLLEDHLSCIEAQLDYFQALKERATALAEALREVFKTILMILSCNAVYILSYKVDSA